MRRAAFAFVFITVLLDMLAFGMIIPVLPGLIVKLQGGDVTVGASTFGLFGAVFALMQFLFAPVLGALSDRFGRRPVILLSNLGLGFDFILMALAPTVALLFVGRVISGITSSSYSTASAYIADVTPPEKRAARFGMLGAAFGIGFIVGPAAGGLLGTIDLRAPFWAAAVLSFANFAYGFFILPESLPADRRAPFRPHAANPIGAMRFLRASPVLTALAVGALFMYLSHDVMPSVAVLYMSYRYAFDASAIGLSLAVAGVSGLIVQAFGVGRIVARLGEYRALVVGLGIATVAQVVMGLAPYGWLFVVGIPLWSFLGISAPSLSAIASQQVDPREQGRLQGALVSVRSIASLAAPLLFTQTFAASIGPLAGLGLPGAAFLLSALLLLISLLIVTNTVRAPAPQPA
jgi:DHA1 family tetracycline resistance protein-like MFS transporter